MYTYVLHMQICCLVVLSKSNVCSDNIGFGWKQKSVVLELPWNINKIIVGKSLIGIFSGGVAKYTRLVVYVKECMNLLTVPLDLMLEINMQP